VIGPRLAPLRFGWGKLAAVLALAAAYAAAAALLWRRTGDSVVAFIAVPIAAAGLLMGLRAGVAAGVAAAALNAALFAALSPSVAAVVSHRWPGMLVGIALGAAAGWASDLLAALRAQAAAMSAERDALQQQVAQRLLVEAELRRANAVLAAARDDAVRATRQKSTFLTNLSHELRTPLTSILGYAEMVLEERSGPGDEALASDVERIVVAGRHLLRLLDDLLDLARIEAGKLALQVRDVEVEPIVREVVEVVRPLAERNRNALEVRVPASLGRMRADETRLRQALLNLLGNACKFTEKGAVVLHVAREPGAVADWLSFRVSDTGIGMTREQVARVFDEFWQADNLPRRGGAGLGLAITRKLCELMGGEMKVDSQLGSGSTFTLRLPVETAGAPN
jgi:signal transduction histidine kinase